MKSANLFRALADPSRRRLLDSLNRQSGQTLRELCAGLDIARQSVSKHLAVLETANLVATVRQGPSPRGPQEDTAFTTDWAKGSPMTWDNHGVVLSEKQGLPEHGPVR